MNIGHREATLNFELKKNIGQEGANSDVFIAHDKQFDANIVIKRIPKQDFTSPKEYYKEAKCLYTSKHQNIVEVNYSCEDDQYIYIAMPFYGKGSLESLLNSRFLSIREIIKYSIGFLSGLNHIHTKGLIHFDIKPTNILVSNSNEALITDFGLAKFTNIHRVAEQSRFYNFHIPPECLTTNKFTIQADIYQAGLTLYRLCNGSSNFKKQLIEIKTKQELHTRILSGQFPNREFFFPHIPLKLKKIVKKALEINPKKRYNNVIEMLNALSKVDDFLDWKLEIQEGKYVWTLEESNKIYDITLINNTDSFEIGTYKTMKTSNRRTKETKNCIKNIELKNIDTELKKIFKSY